MERKIKFVVNAVRWFDKKNGNTYHSVNITDTETGAKLYGAYQYGYGEHYRQTALELMADAKWLPEQYQGKNSNGSSRAYAYERENDYPILWNVTDGKKRDCIANGKES